jgi:hypothetical protein
MNHQGKRKAKCVGSDKRLAVQVQKQLEAKLTLGDVGLLKEEPETVLFRDYAEQWLHTYVATKCKPSSARVIRQTVRNHLAYSRQEGPDVRMPEGDSVHRCHRLTFSQHALRGCSGAARQCA